MYYPAGIGKTMYSRWDHIFLSNTSKLMANIQRKMKKYFVSEFKRVNWLSNKIKLSHTHQGVDDCRYLLYKSKTYPNTARYVTSLGLCFYTWEGYVYIYTSVPRIGTAQSGVVRRECWQLTWVVHLKSAVKSCVFSSFWCCCRCCTRIPELSVTMAAKTVRLFSYILFFEKYLSSNGPFIYIFRILVKEISVK